jgi:hypothetical protein
MVSSNSSFEVLLFYKKIKIPAKQLGTPKLVELVSFKPYNYALWFISCHIKQWLMVKMSISDCQHELEYSHIDMFMTCVLVYSPCVMSISYMVMYGLFSISVMCRLVYSLHIIHMLS